MTDPNSKKPIRRWRRRVFWTFVVLLLFAGPPLTYVYYRRTQAHRELAEIMAELDRADPGWRLEDIEAKRGIIPDEQNSVPLILRVDAALGTGKWFDWDLDEELAKIPPPLLLFAAQEERLKKDLEPLAKPLGDAYKLADLPRGRHKVAYSADFISTVQQDQQKARTVAHLLALDARRQVQAGDPERAARACQAILGVAGSFGDEPLPISHLVRFAMQNSCIAVCERVLAHGQLAPASLAELQRRMQAEADENLAWIALRGERAGHNLLFTNIENGKCSWFQLSGKPSPVGLWNRVKDQFQLEYTLRSHAAYLRHSTTCVDAVKDSGHRKSEVLGGLIDLYSRLDKRTREQRELVFVVFWLLSANKMIDSERRQDTHLDCAISALAAERFRLEQERWPNSLDELVKLKYLAKMPIDLFDGEPLRSRATENGLVIYSIGPDKKYDGTALDDLTKYDPETKRIEFRLWNPEFRRQPPPGLKKP